MCRLVDYGSRQHGCLTKSSSFKEQQKDLEAQVAEFSKQADQIVTKQSTLQSKREEAYKKVGEGAETLLQDLFEAFN